VRTIRGQEALIALVANKIDCERIISESEAKDYAKSRDILYFEVSAKTGYGI
jgi:predicted GTPase